MSSVLVEEKWLQSLVKIAQRTKKDQDKWFLGTKELMPESVSMLIGYALSAQTLLKYAPKKRGDE